ncbi:MAG: hypothetical protein ABIA91_02195 [Patescibacteria group bacterium]
MNYLLKNKIFSKKIILFLFFIFISFVVFYPVLDNFFFSDDFSWLARSKYELNSFHDIIFLRFAGFWRASINLYFYLIYHVFGTNPAFYYILNILLHGVNGFLVFLLSKKIIKSSKIGFLSAVIFIISHIHYSSILWISAVTSLLNTFFILITLNLFWTYLRKNIFLIYLLGLFSFVFALLTKETSAILLPLLFCVFIYFYVDKQIKIKVKSFIILLPFVFLEFLYLTIQYLFFRNNLSVYGYNYDITLFGVKKFLFNFIYSFFGVSNFYISVLFFIFLFLVLVILIKKNRVYLKTIVFFSIFVFLTYLPPAFFSLGQGKDWLFAPRYAYLPTVGVSCILAIIVYICYGKINNKKYIKRIFVLFLLFLVTVNIYFIRIEIKKYFILSQVSQDVYLSLVEFDKQGYLDKNIFIVGDFPFKHNPTYLFDMLRLYFDVPDHKIHFMEADYIPSTVSLHNNFSINIKWDYETSTFFLLK